MTVASRKIPAGCRILTPRIMPSASYARSRVRAAKLRFLIENNFVPIGMVGVSWRDAQTTELGYWLGTDYWGQGFATEAARAAIDFFFEETENEFLHSGARVSNAASRNVLEKCGFQWSGVELHRFEALGSSTPVDCFRLSRGVWSSLKDWANSTRKGR
jgi:RimJ/RimL family protein N-acetyltransferase